MSNANGRDCAAGWNYPTVASTVTFSDAKRSSTARARARAACIYIYTHICGGCTEELASELGPIDDRLYVLANDTYVTRARAQKIQAESNGFRKSFVVVVVSLLLESIFTHRRANAVSCRAPPAPDFQDL